MLGTLHPLNVIGVKCLLLCSSESFVFIVRVLVSQSITVLALYYGKTKSVDQNTCDALQRRISLQTID